jgi:hypothetical protein
VSREPGREGVAERDGRRDLQVVGLEVDGLGLGGELRDDGAGGAVDQQHLPVDAEGGEDLAGGLMTHHRS